MQANIPNEISTMDELAKFFSKYEEIYFYGAGDVGKLLLSYTKKSWNVNKFGGFIVSECRNESDNIEAYQTFSVDSWFEKNGNKKDDSIAILITTTQKYQSEIYGKVKRKNCDLEIWHVSDALISTLRYFELNSITSVLKNIKKLVSNQSLLIEKQMPITELCFSVPLCGHCNLNCAGVMRLRRLLMKTIWT